MIETEAEYAPAVIVKVLAPPLENCVVGIDNVADELVTVILPDSESPFMSAVMTPVMV